jgi:hypothetical protein
MTFDLTVFPVDRALTYDEAAAEVQRVSGWRLGLGHDPRLDGFIAEMERRYPSLSGRSMQDPPCEFDVSRGSVFLALGWSSVLSMAPDVCDVAYRNGLAVWDPQREVVGLPAPYADGPLGAEGLIDHVTTATQVLGAAVAGLVSGAALGEEPAQRAMSEQLRSIGARQMSPLGFEVTPELEDEVFADPTRYPPSLQTPVRKAELLADLAATSSSGDRHAAVAALAAWDPDPEVAAALRPSLLSEDVFETGTAANGLARQGDITDLPGVLGAVHRMSPADGGSVAAMLEPLRAAIVLAERAGPEIVLGVKAQARAWRGVAAPARWERDADVAFDLLLADRPAPG